MVNSNETESTASHIIKTTEDMVRGYVTSLGISLVKLNNGDIFRLTRELVMDASERENVTLDNPTQMYFWLRGFRDELKKSA